VDAVGLLTNHYASMICGLAELYLYFTVPNKTNGRCCSLNMTFR